MALQRAGRVHRPFHGASPRRRRRRGHVAATRRPEDSLVGRSGPVTCTVLETGYACDFTSRTEPVGAEVDADHRNLDLVPLLQTPVTHRRAWLVPRVVLGADLRRL